ncbi:MAG: restriction endonuclease subunit S [Hyphomicrobiales bacterium]|nr:MAG: restriction endonuclease subunit S [Hyphomicrobiales bacterium]
MMQPAERADAGKPAWAASLPHSWRTKKVKHVAKFTTGWTPPTGNAASYVGTNLWATIGDLGPKTLENTANQISDEAARQSGIPLSQAGSLLFSFKLSVGQVSIAGRPMFTNEAIATFAPEHDYSTRWAFYAFPVFIPENSAINIYGAKLLNQQRINDAFIPLPPLGEQDAIASYLDSETERIDRLIEEKRRLAEMLVELRDGVIRERTTGADLETELNATGDKFMPALPVGWSLVSLGRYARITNGSTPLKDNSSYWHGGHYPWLNSSVVNGDEVSEGSELVTSEALRQCHLPIVPAGSVLVALTGQGKTRGQATVLRIEATINQHLAAIICDEEHLDGEFVFWALTGQYAALRMVSDGQGGTKGALTCDELGRFRIPKPPIDIQRSIAKALYEETRRIDNLLAHVEAEIALLQELRSATITDAVLGRIDVRHHTKN